MNKVKGFTYDPIRDKDVIEHINKQPHQSKYILNLVREDMNKPNKIEELVKKYVEELLKNKNITISNNGKNISKKDINQLLNIKK